MIRLHQYPSAWGLSSLSPFCMKVETYCRQHRIPFETVVEFNPRRGPKGKMPYVEDGKRVIADSGFIVDYLREKHHLPKLPIAGIPYLRLLEESLYWVLLYSRWVDEKGWEHTRQGFAPLFPYGLGPVAVRIIRRELMKQAHAQGISRHRPEEVYALGKKDLAALAEALGNRQTFFEDGPTALDASLYAFLDTFLKTPYEGPLRQAVESNQNLVDYRNYWTKRLLPGDVACF